MLTMSKFIDRMKIFLFSSSYCSVCEKQIYGIYNYKCHYCHKHFCNEHRLPESHKCKGNPKALEGGFREIHEAGGGVKAGW